MTKTTVPALAMVQIFSAVKISRHIMTQKLQRKTQNLLPATVPIQNKLAVLNRLPQTLQLVREITGNIKMTRNQMHGVQKMEEAVERTSVTPALKRAQLPGLQL
jgi:hypothetical protein